MKTILMMEDDPYEAQMVMRVMEHHGYKVLHASTAERGLQMALENQPDIILLDLGLPDLDGQTVAALLRSMPHLADVPLIAVTAWPPDTACQMARAYGCTGFISKPISPRQFPAQIAACLEPAQRLFQATPAFQTQP